MKLPVEVVHNIFSSLDFDSLGKLRLVSYMIKVIVEAVPVYRCMVELASTALGTLTKTKIISEFSAAQLYNVLSTDRCVGRGDYGPYLLLPTLSVATSIA